MLQLVDYILATKVILRTHNDEKLNGLSLFSLKVPVFQRFKHLEKFSLSRDYDKLNKRPKQISKYIAKILI